ncbi:hypothetical protein B0H19DRAFT_67244 [Mycena capillaripes]|nr:hypothetical protein B0H19DRAFT_67244 [Mycena capillaripes]
MSSPFAARLGTNYCPKDEDIVDIKALLVEPSLRLKRLDEEIADLQKAIDKLAAEREELGTFVESHKALISPVRRLPLDIIQEIFVACIPTHRNCVMSASEAPVLLGRICSSWRAISLSTPRLWARLHVVEPLLGYGPAAELHEKKAAQRLEVTKMWLGRSGQCPLSISLQSGSDYDSPPVTPTTVESPSSQLLEVLIGFASRWQHIILTTPASMLNKVHLMVTEVPMLESVTFQLPPGSVQWEPFELLSSPSISSFSVSGNSFVPDKLPLHWHRLTDITISGYAWESLLTSEMVLQMLSRCPELRSCQLAINDGAAAETLLHSTVELRFLHTLILDFGSVASKISRLFERLSLPELRTFILYGSADPGSPFSLAPFFGSWTRLENLTIASNTFSPSCLLETLRSLPSTLRRLTIIEIIEYGGPGVEIGPLDEDVLEVLAISRAPLEYLYISCSTISDEALLKFITARMTAESHAKLEHIAILFNRKMMFDILPSLESFIENGLDISIIYPPPLQTTSTGFSPWQGLAMD